jgi:hypothetical protein
VNTAFEVTLSEADLVHAFRLNARRPTLRPMILAAILIAALLTVLVAISPTARHTSTTGPLALMLEGALALAGLLLLAVFLTRPMIFRALARRMLIQRAELMGPIRWEFDEESIRHTTIHSDSHYPWPALRGWREDGSILLLYVADNLFYIVPKAQAGEEVIDSLRKNIEAGGVPRS